MNHFFSSLIVMATLSLTFFTSCQNNKSTQHKVEVATSSKSDGKMTGRIGFVNIDTFEAHYDYLKTKREAFQKKQQAIEDELIRIEKQLQSEAAAFQKKAQTGGMTQNEGEATQKRLMQQGQSLEQKRQSYTEQLMKEQQAFNEELHKTLQAFLKEYNAEKGFDYILSYAEGGSILLANDALDITQAVIDGMNQRKNNTTDLPAADSTKK